MKHAGHVETEIKCRIASLEAMGMLLGGCGFAPAHPQVDETSVLWDREGALQARGSALRLRRYDGAAFLTWKGPREEDPLLKIRPELETAVADPLAMEGILGELGYVPGEPMVKSRSVWRRGDLEACLDEAPFGCYLELEGEPGAIREAMRELGLDETQVEPRSYPALFLAHRAKG
jgi:adenylate cyclase, class 2